MTITSNHEKRAAHCLCVLNLGSSQSTPASAEVAGRISRAAKLATANIVDAVTNLFLVIEASFWFRRASAATLNRRPSRLAILEIAKNTQEEVEIGKPIYFNQLKNFGLGPRIFLEILGESPPGCLLPEADSRRSPVARRKSVRVSFGSKVTN